ncbi:hypothetical protein [Methylocaldum sp.]|uniref:hypothetical protein n=1 Tax=Methylocaldum sp. TaxID=1969727 RepID=UPI002D437285|nr:hypothetical protein [Methylocaldum sp.]HYE34310.1 hypothetical protein [Methylocaldum sp.]
MKWPFFSFKKKHHTDDHNHNEELLDRYKQFRKTGIGLNTMLAKQVPKAAVPECGKKLGLFKAGTLIFNNDDEVGILYDYCFHHYRRAGKNVIERYLEQSPPASESTEMILLQAMVKSRYSLFRVEEINPHLGATLRDLLTGEALNLMDIGLSETGSPGIILAGRILPLADFYMSSGTLIPLPEPVFEQSITPIIRKFSHDKSPQFHPLFSPAQEASFTAQVIRVSLHAGGEDNVFYTDMDHPAW